MKKIEELLGLKPMSDNADSNIGTIDVVEDNQSAIIAIDSAMDKIDTALPLVRDLDASDKEMDELADLATTTFKDLMELSYNVEPRFSGPIIQSASTILGHAVTAKMAKMDKKLKMVDLQLKKAKLDQTATTDKESPIDGQGMVLDRNELLKLILNKPQNG